MVDMLFEEDDYRYDIYCAYRNIAIYLTLIIIACAILTYYLLYLFHTGDAHMFNLTNESFEYMKNATIGRPIDVVRAINGST